MAVFAKDGIYHSAEFWADHLSLWCTKSCFKVLCDFITVATPCLLKEGTTISRMCIPSCYSLQPHLVVAVRNTEDDV